MSLLYAILGFAAGALVCYLVLRERLRAHEQLSVAFKATSAEALRAGSEQFLQLAEATLSRFHSNAASDLDARQTAIETTVGPLRETLHKMDTQLRHIEVSRAGAYSDLTRQVQSLITTQESLRRETGKLATALVNPTARGRWGEIQLKRVVELAGMLQYCDFVEQTGVATPDTTLRPDMIIRLPNEKQIVVDSKVPMRAYLDACDLAEEAARVAKLRDHAAQIRKHLKRLGEKAYCAHLPESPEFVVAFLPGEIFFSAALQADPELLEYGVQNNVILATPTTLIALLKAVAYGWKQEQVTKNAQEIQRLGAVLYDRVRVFAEHYLRVGKSLENAVSSFEDGRRSMETRLLATARKFEEFGIAPTGSGALPEPLPFPPPLRLSVDDESGSDAGRGGESTGSRRSQPA